MRNVDKHVSWKKQREKQVYSKRFVFLVLVICLIGPRSSLQELEFPVLKLYLTINGNKPVFRKKKC